MHGSIISSGDQWGKHRHAFRAQRESSGRGGWNDQQGGHQKNAHDFHRQGEPNIFGESNSQRHCYHTMAPAHHITLESGFYSGSHWFLTCTKLLLGISTYEVLRTTFWCPLTTAGPWLVYVAVQDDRRRPRECSRAAIAREPRMRLMRYVRIMNSLRSFSRS